MERAKRLAAGIAVLLCAAPAGAAVPPGFTDSLVTVVGAPTALAFTPDGRMLITTQPGVLRVYQGGTLLPTPALTFAASRICNNSERGLLGVAVDPGFATNNYVYLYYTFNKFNACPTGVPTDPTNPVNRVSRFVLPAGNVINPASEVVLVDNMVSANGNHNAGDLNFGRDGYLYVSVGDGGADYAGDSGSGGANDASRDQHILLGKILRIAADGSIPPTNPFQGATDDRCNVNGRTTPGRRCQETLAWGLRNPFRMAFDPGAVGTRFFINDVGQNAWEEIDLGQSGVDYGWNCREGAHTNSATGKCNPTPPAMVDPVFEYQHGATVPGTTSPTNCNAITGGAFVPAGSWPTAYDGSYLFADYVCGWIFLRTPGGAVSDFATNLGGSSAVELRFGPFGGGQALYYTTYAGGGQVRRIAFTGSANRAPTAVLSANPTAGGVPLLVNFDGSGSSDPDAGNTLTYIWDFGDGSPVVQTASPTQSHTYASIGVFTAILRVRDNLGATSDPAVVVISPGNTPPVPVIVTPTTSDRFRVGQSVTLNGSASDAQDGALPPTALSWVVILHHSTHTHPFLGPVVGNGIVFTAPPPEDLLAASNSYLEIRLTATDSLGLSATVTQNFDANRVNLTFATVPPGLGVLVNGASLTGPQTVVSWEAWDLAVSAPDQLDVGGQDYVFQSWSDGGAGNHTITTPASPATYTATFVVRPLTLCGNEAVVTPDGRLSAASLGAGSSQWLLLATHPGYSYSLEIQNRLGASSPGTLTLFRGDDGCGPSTAAPRNTTTIDPAAPVNAQRLAFTSSSSDRNYRLRLDNGSGAAVTYSFSLAETTLFSPSWTTNGTYDTYYSLQNTTNATITATLTLFRTDGTGAASTTLTIPSGATASTNTVSLGTPRNGTGAARLTHDGPPGALLAEAAIANFSLTPAYVQPVRFRSVREAR